MFGLIESKGGTVDLTRLGERILQPEHEAAARVDAFLHVELYNELYQAFSDRVLPTDDQGLESRIRDLGVTPNQAGRARQVFARSAKQAGFFEKGNNRLVAPHTAKATPKEAETEQKSPRSTVGPTVVVGGDVMADPMLMGLMRRMLPKEGEKFSAAQRSLFFSALAFNLDVIYGPPDDGQIDPGTIGKLISITVNDTMVRTDDVTIEGSSA
jgi:hypothetical protein